MTMATGAQAQSISEIANADPLIITGAVGTQNTYTHSTSGGVSNSVLNNSIYANLNISVYGISMPFSFYYTNGGASWNWSYPTFTFNISPTYKNWTLYIGQHNMSFSNYVYNCSTNGVGVEYNGKVRFGVFYGQLKKAINDDPTDPYARTPQYSRNAWGVKAGYGSGNNYIDVYVFKAWDNESSLNESWRTKVAPQDNLAFGVKGRVTPFKNFSLNANVAMSIFTQDTNSATLSSDDVNGWDKIFDAKASSLYRFAGDFSASYRFRQWSLSANYKIVQPDYMTLGSNYMTNNYESYGASLSGSLFKSRVAVGGNFSGQRDNITKKQSYTTRGYVYAAYANWNINRHLGFNGTYNGYLQTQGDGTLQVNDTTRVHRIMHAATGSLNYSFGSQSLPQSLGLSYSLSMNKDLNKFNTGSGDVTSHAFGAAYSINISSIGVSTGLSANHQISKSATDKFTTDVISLSGSRAFLKEKNLSTSLSISGSRNATGSQNTMSWGASVSANYVLKQVHVFSLSGSYSKYNSQYVAENTTTTGSSYAINFNYNYTFSLVSILSKAHKEEAKKREEQERREAVAAGVSQYRK